MELLLVRRAQKGDAEAFVELIETHKMALYKVAKSYLKSEEDIADVMQDTILSAYEHIWELKKSAYFKTWITRILMNHCNDLLKQQRYFVKAGWEEDREGSAPSGDREFYELLSELSEDVRPIFLLHYGEGFSTKEVAQILDMNENTVKSRLMRGRKKLKTILCC